jgi:hypothetical protein
MMRARTDITDALRTRIMGGNAERFYKLAH